MKWIDRLTECVDYIEDNLKGEIDINKLCEISCLSRFYFPRLFEAVTDMTLSQYIRQRRMTLAAKELSSSDRKVIEIAFDYGYSTPESFSRAFKSVHGISPSKLRTNNPAIKSYSKLVFTISIKGDVEMDYKIVEKEAFKLLGLSIITTNKENQNLTEIPQFWVDSNANGICDKLYGLSSIPGESYGVCYDFNGENTFEYAIAVPYNDGETNEFQVINIPSSKWAIFECIGPMPDSIQTVWRRIFSEWLPATEHELTNLPQIELYYPGNCSSPNYKSEIWIPVK